MTTPKKSPDHFWVWSKCPRIPLLQLLNSFGDTFLPNHTLISSKSSVTPEEFPFHIVDGKKIHQIWGMAWPGPGFSGICAKKLSLIHTPNFFQSTFLDWKNFTKVFKTLFFLSIYVKWIPKGETSGDPEIFETRRTEG